jgi:hypothetical protein
MTATDTQEPIQATDTQAPEVSPNRELWLSYEDAFNYFNEALFEGKLPECILTFNAKGRSWGYLKRKSWLCGAGTDLHEICLNPYLLTRDDDMIFQLLVRCMVGLWQHAYGEPSRVERYCSTEFTAKMAEIGLPCEEPCGLNVKHKVDENGRYARIRPRAVNQFFSLKNQVQMETARKTRIKYECPACGFSAMASAGGKLFCHTEGCNVEMLKALEQ